MVPVYIFPIIFILIFLGIIYFVIIHILKLLERKNYYKKGVYFTFSLFFSMIFIEIIAAYLNIKFLGEIFFMIFTFLFLSFFVNIITISLTKIFKFKNKTELILILSINILIFIIGIYSAQTYEIKTLEFSSNKISKNYNLVLISDVHIGSESVNYLNKIVAEIETLSPDAVFLTGDFIDANWVTQNDLKIIENLNVPIYYVFGNHEYISNRDENFFSNISNLKFVNNKFEEFDELNIIGIDTYIDGKSFSNNVNVSKLINNIDYDKSKYNILLKHEPDKIEDLMNRNIDLILSGHTHNGQIFPFNFLVKLRYNYIYGIYNLDNLTNLYVTSGTGVWGPNLRFGSNNEIIQIKIKSIN